MKLYVRATTIAVGLCMFAASRNAAAVAIATTPAQVPTLTPAQVIQQITNHTSAEIETWVAALPVEERKVFFDLLRKTLEVESIVWSDADLAKIERLATFYDSDNVFFDAFLAKNECNDANALTLADATTKQKKCTTFTDGAAFALYSRVALVACWKTLALASGAPTKFRQGIREYYRREAGSESPELNECEAPPVPTRCKLAKCSL